MAVYQRVLRSMKVATPPFACPRPDMTELSSQWPNVSRLRISFRRLAIGVPILNRSLVSRGFWRLPFCRRTVSGTSNRPL